jgi:hypothetical protein
MTNNAPKEPSPPDERCFASIDRGDREKLVLALDEYKDHPYLNLRVWACLDDGRWVPTKKGVTIRLAEALTIAGAIRNAIDAIDAEGRGATDGQA